MNLNKIDTDQVSKATHSLEQCWKIKFPAKTSEFLEHYLQALSFLRELHIACLQRDAQPKRTPRPKDLDPPKHEKEPKT